MKISWNLKVCGKINWSMNSEQQMAGYSMGYLKKKSFQKFYKKCYQSCNNLQSCDPFLHLGFLNCPNFDTIFCRVFKIKIFFLNIPSYPLPVTVRKSLTNQFYQTNWSFWIFSNQKRVQNWNVEKGPRKTCHFFLDISRN